MIGGREVLAFPIASFAMLQRAFVLLLPASRILARVLTSWLHQTNAEVLFLRCLYLDLSPKSLAQYLAAMAANMFGLR